MRDLEHDKISKSTALAVSSSVVEHLIDVYVNDSRHLYNEIRNLIDILYKKKVGCDEKVRVLQEYQKILSSLDVSNNITPNDESLIIKEHLQKEKNKQTLVAKKSKEEIESIENKENEEIEKRKNFISNSPLIKQNMSLKNKHVDEIILYLESEKLEIKGKLESGRLLSQMKSSKESNETNCEKNKKLMQDINDVTSTIESVLSLNIDFEATYYLDILERNTGIKVENNKFNVVSYDDYNTLINKIENTANLAHQEKTSSDPHTIERKSKLEVFKKELLYYESRKESLEQILVFKENNIAQAKKILDLDYHEFENLYRIHANNNDILEDSSRVSNKLKQTQKCEISNDIIKLCDDMKNILTKELGKMHRMVLAIPESIQISDELSISLIDKFHTKPNFQISYFQSNIEDNKFTKIFILNTCFYKYLIEKGHKTTQNVQGLYDQFKNSNILCSKEYTDLFDTFENIKRRSTIKFKNTSMILADIPLLKGRGGLDYISLFPPVLPIDGEDLKGILLYPGRKLNK